MQLSIPRSAAEPYISAATLFGILALPPLKPTDRKFQSAADALCRQAVLRKLAEIPNGAREPRMVTPAFLLLPGAKAEQLLRETRKRLQDRMGAAHAAMPFFQEAERVVYGGTPSRRRKQTVDQQAQRVIDTEATRLDWLAGKGHAPDRSFPTDANNFDNRLIRSTLPVLHIAAAVAIVMDMFEKELRKLPVATQEAFPGDMNGPQLSLDLFLDRPELVEIVVEQAERLAKLLPNLPRLKVNADKIVQLSMA